MDASTLMASAIIAIGGILYYRKNYSPQAKAARDVAKTQLSLAAAQAEAAAVANAILASKGKPTFLTGPPTPVDPTLILAQKYASSGDIENYVKTISDYTTVVVPQQTNYFKV